MPMTKAQRQRLLNNWVSRKIQTRLIPAIVGKVEDDGTISVKIAGQKNRIWVRPYSADNQAQQAINLRIKAIKNMTVRLEINEEGLLEVYDIDPFNGTELYGELAPGLNSPSLGEASDVILPGRNYKPGRVRPTSATSLVVHVESFWYRYGGVLTLWPGGTVDLSSYVPATTDYYQLAAVCINPRTNALVVIAGGEKANRFLVEDDAVADLSTEGLIHVDTVRLQEGATAFTNELEDFVHSRIQAADIGGDHLSTNPQTVASDYYHIPSGRNALWLGPVTVTGTLTVEGILRII